MLSPVVNNAVEHITNAAAKAMPENPSVLIPLIVPALIVVWLILDPDCSDGTLNLVLLKLLFATSASLMVGCHAGLYFRIARLSETEMVTLPSGDTVTAAEHDRREWFKLLQQAAVGIPMTLMIGFSWKASIAPFVQSFHLPINMLTHNLCKVHLMGEEPVGKLARPWKVPLSPFAEYMTSKFGTQSGESTNEATPTAGRKKERSGSSKKGR